MKGLRLCLIEDDAIMGESLVERFRLEGLACDWHRQGAAAIRALQGRRYDLVVSDLRLGDMGGDEIFHWAHTALAAAPPFVFITGYGTVEQAVALIKEGARDYVTKPFDLDALMQRIVDWLPRDASGGESPLGVSPAMRRIAESLPRIAGAASTVLLVGESGVGKERVAQALHAACPHSASRPLVAVNCGALSESLLEAELFGYEKGAFTGAGRTKPGVFEQAGGGTLFLDEIGEMPPAMQVRLLRVIQERRVTRVGGEASLPVDFLLICATHRDLRKRVAEGSFREDLYYRINVLQIRVPPLRERREDIPWFARRFLEDIAVRSGGPLRRLAPDAETAILDYPWPGNVRELHHAIERAAILSSSPLIPARALFDDDLPQPATVDDDGVSLNEHLRQCERRYIERALVDGGWQIAQTADRLGISRKNLWEKMRKLEIEPPTGRR